MLNLSQPMKEKLYNIFGEKRAYFDDVSCLAYGYDNSKKQVKATAVVFPQDIEEIVKLVQFANTISMPIIARGFGSNTTGATVPIAGGIILSFERFNRLIEINTADRYMIVEAGMTNQAVQDIAQSHGFFWVPDPGSSAFCTVGGNIACNAAGPRAVKYGATRENILGLTAVTGCGKIIHTGSKTTKNSMGYDLTRLLIGSEGTLAIITQAILKLTPLPKAELTMRIAYHTLSAAMSAVERIMAQHVGPCILEFLDYRALSLIRHDKQLQIPNAAQALLLIKLDGNEAGLDDVAQSIQFVAKDKDLCLCEIASDADAAQSFWRARKILSPALRTIAANKINEDVVVPLSKLAILINYIDGLSQENDLIIVNFGHAGNGNIHVNILYDDGEANAIRARKVLNKIFEKVIELGGILSGEHGIGYEKKSFLPLVFNEEEIDLMKQIKKVFDPNQILNPGKIFPE
jgi:D-lactate dehydrogenase